MPSPFPGMDPYLESAEAWRDFHHRYIPAASAALLRHLPEQYIVKVEENVYIRELSAEDRRLAGRPDASVVSVGRRPTGGAAAATLAPVTAALVQATDEDRIPFLQVVDRLSRAVVTVIELLSPSNKSNADDRAAYLGKRQRIAGGTSNFVELDLLRGGPRMPLAGLPACDYYALVSRPQDRPQVGVWPVMLRDRLPTIPIPLAHGDADVPLDLQAVLDRTYDEAGYARYVYATPPEPPLSADDAAWAAGLLRPRTMA